MTLARHTPEFRDRRYPQALQVILWLASALVACEPGATGDSCWSDWDCSFNSCTFGTCDSDGVALLLFLADVVSSSSGTSPDGDTESAPACTYISYCDPLPGCSSDPAAVDACFACLTSAPCPPQCEEDTYCY